MRNLLMKTVLTLGLVCFCCAEMAALPAWGDNYQVVKYTNSIYKLQDKWNTISMSNYYLYYDAENGTWGTTQTLPTSDLAEDWKNYLFATKNYNTTTSTEDIICANGKYLAIDAEGNLTASDEQYIWQYKTNNPFAIQNNNQYIYIDNGVLKVGTIEEGVEFPEWSRASYNLIAPNQANYHFTQGNYTYTITKKATTSTPGEVTVKLANNNVTNAVIASSVEDAGYTYNVTSIGQFAQDGNFPGTFPYGDNCNSPQTYASFDSHPVNRYNPTLKSVTFEEPCHVTTIESYAFDGCDALTSFTVPYSVTTLGSYAFYLCRHMTSFYFQTNEEGETQITKINERTFKFCESLKSLELPEGITETGKEALQFNISMTTLKLPNSLTTIGSHFMCSAISLSTLTIPANVTYIAGSAFHGCESLRTVYLLGPASALQPGTDERNKTFGKNRSYCADGVHDCIFYTTMDYIETYQNADTWNEVDGDNGKNTIGNFLRAPIPNTRTLQKGQWATICFAKLPDTEAEFNAIFGDKGVDSEEGWKVAIMVKAEVDTHSSERGENGEPNLYHTYYKTIPFDEIKINTPYLICPGKTVENYVAWDSKDEENTEFKENMTINHNVVQTASDGARVYMVGRILGVDELYPDDIYFKAKSEVGTDMVIGGFYQVQNGIKVKLGACRAYWHIYQNGVKSSDSSLGGAKQINNSEVDAINEISNDIRIVVGGIYDMNGRKLNVSQDQLPKGMYIMNGKKVYNQ